MRYPVDGFVPLLQVLFAFFMAADVTPCIFLSFLFKLSFSYAFTPPTEKIKGLIAGTHGATFSPGTA